MKRLLLERKQSAATFTDAFLTLQGAGILATIERPWVDAPTPGGKPYASCVPAGVYDLKLHTRGGGAIVPALINPALGVHYLEADLPDAGGRFLILMHVGNWAHDVVGCIAPGLWHEDSSQGRMVKSSKMAMRRVMAFIGDDEAQLEVRWL